MRMQKVCKAVAEVYFPANVEETMRQNVDTGRASMSEHWSALSFFKE